MSQTIFVFGDSIGKGVGDTQECGWAHRLDKYFRNKEHDISLYNLSISGDTSADVLQRFEAEMSFRERVKEETVIVFAVGTND